MADELGFDAGSIFVQVVPSFRDTQKIIGREAKGFGDELEKQLSDGMERGAEKGAKRAGEKLKGVIGEEIGKDADKAGEKAADQYAGAFRTRLQNAIKAMQKEIKPIEFNTASEKTLADLDRVKAKLDELGKTKISPGMDTKRIRQDLDDVLRDVEKLGKGAELEVRADTKAARASVEAFKKYVDSIDPVVEVEVKIDKKLADRELGAFEKLFRAKMKSAAASIGENVSGELARLKTDLKTLGDSEIGIDISASQAMRQLEEIHLAIAQINGTTADVNVRVDSGKALAELVAIHREVDKIDGATARVESKGSLIDRLLGGKGSGGRGQEVTNAFRTFNGVLLAAITLGPALIPILAGIGGGMAALAPMALAGAAGIGVLLLAFNGIGAAVTALNAQQDKAGVDATKNARTMRNAAQGVQDAERSLSRARADAAQANKDAAKAVSDAVQSAEERNQQAARRTADVREQAAKAVEAAIKRQADTEKRLADAQRDATKAQNDLAQARLDAQKQLEDIADRSKQNALDIRQAQIDLFNATTANNAVQADPGATNLEKEQSDINLKQAQLRIEELRDSQKDLAEQKKKADKTGVEGTDIVVNAQDRLNQALEAQKEAQDDVKQSAKDLRDAQKDGIQNVNDALADQKKAAQDGAEAIASAVEQERRTRVSSAQSVGDAQRGLTRAQQAYNDALYDTGTKGSAAAQQVAIAMANLGPAGQAFALFIHGLRDDFQKIQEIAAKGLLPGVTEALKTLISQYGPGFTKFIGDVATALGEIAVNVGKVLTGDSFQAFFAAFSGAGPQMVTDFGKALVDWLEVAAQFMTLALPTALKLSGYLVDLAQHADKFMKSAKGQKLWTDFFKYVDRVGPEIMEFFFALVGAVINIGKALAPVGEDILKLLTTVLNWISQMDPKTLQLIVVGILGLAAAFQIAAAATFLLGAATTFLTSPLQIVIVIIGLVAIALYLLYTRNETARKIIDAAIRGIGAVFSWLWDNVLKPFFQYAVWIWGVLAAAAVDAWQKWISPTLSAIGSVIAWLWTKIFYPYLKFIIGYWTFLAKTFLWVWENILWPVFKVVAKIAWELYQKVFSVVFGMIAEAFKGLATAFQWTYDHLIAPLFEIFMDLIGNRVVKAFQDAVGFIRKHWDTIKDIAKAPIDFFIDVVMNKGLIGGFNKLAEFLHMDKVGTIPWPPPGWNTPPKPSSGGGGGGHAIFGSAFANGGVTGVMPGYTPGRDVFSIAVSGGEAVMRPEWTRAIKQLDPDYIDEMNKQARLGGVGAVMRSMRGYKNGGEVQGGSGVGIYDRATWRGKSLDYYTIQLLQAAEKLTGQTVHITQGSYSTSVAASGSTHAGGGVFDLGWPGGATGQALVAALRQVGFAAWHRNPSQGPWNDHIHGVALNDPTESASAQAQVRDYLNGGNGLGGKDDGPNVAKDKSLLGKLLGGISGLAGWVSDAIKDPADWLKGQITGPLKDLTSKFGDNILTKTLSKLPDLLVGGLTDRIKGIFTGEQGGASSDLKGMAQEMLGNYGWQSQWAAFDWLVTKESSWNPKADNPNSSAYGLGQLLAGTAPRTDDPREQLTLMMNYIQQRYGSPEAAKSFHEVHGWYKDGGEVVPNTPASIFDTPTDLYDNGGIVPQGLSQVLNLTGGNEHAAVFTTDQWARLQTANGAGDINVDITMQGSNTTAADVADEVLFAARRIRRGGAYAGSN